MVVWLVVGLIIVIIVIITIVISLAALINGTRCTHCRKAFALKEIDSTLINKEKVSKLERHYNYNKKGKITGSRDVRVYGTRKTYEVNYLCKYCGTTTTKTESIDVY